MLMNYLNPYPKDSVSMNSCKYYVLLLGIIFAGAAVMNSGCASDPIPPVAQKNSHVDTVLNHERSDEYFWLRDRENPDVIAYLEAENAYTAEVMKHTEKLQEKIYEEIVGRIKETDLSVPVKRDDYYY